MHIPCGRCFPCHPVTFLDSFFDARLRECCIHLCKIRPSESFFRIFLHVGVSARTKVPTGAAAHSCTARYHEPIIAGMISCPHQVGGRENQAVQLLDETSLPTSNQTAFSTSSTDCQYDVLSSMQRTPLPSKSQWLEGRWVGLSLPPYAVHGDESVSIVDLRVRIYKTAFPLSLCYYCSPTARPRASNMNRHPIQELIKQGSITLAFQQGYQASCRSLYVGGFSLQSTKRCRYIMPSSSLCSFSSQNQPSIYVLVRCPSGSSIQPSRLVTNITNIFAKPFNSHVVCHHQHHHQRRRNSLRSASYRYLGLSQYNARLRPCPPLLRHYSGHNNSKFIQDEAGHGVEALDAGSKLAKARHALVPRQH
ncbi:hypothetical protein F4808DRAFT_366445 [Astrocystis sublimbata]|nr:hypothetical protein F4808DRAFT_366445 [Astrocystis sublimbata]